MVDGPYHETWKNSLTSSGIDAWAQRDEPLGLDVLLMASVERN